MVTPLRFSAVCCTSEPARVHRRGGAGQRHRDQFGRDHRPGAVDQVLAGQVGPQQGWGGTDVEDRDRAGGQGRVAAGHDREHLLHRPPGVLAKGAGDDRFTHEQQGQIQAVQVADLFDHIGADQGRALRVDLRQCLDQLHQADEVFRERRALLLGVRVEDRNGRRAGIEVDSAPAVLHRRNPVQVEEREAPRGAFQGGSHDPLGQARQARGPIDGGAGFGQQGQRLIVVDAHPGVVQQLKRFVEDLGQQVVGQDLESGPHAGSPCGRQPHCRTPSRRGSA